MTSDTAWQRKYDKLALQLFQTKQELHKWKEIAYAVYGSGLGHDGGCPANIRNEYLRNLVPSVLLKCDCGKSLFDELTRCNAPDA